MEVVLESFSIREYALATRGVDLGKCWPFDGEVSALPALEVRKFRWWGDELEAARRRRRRSPEASCPARVGGGGRSKQRAPKKRSIMELCAVAPLANTGGIDGDGGGNGDGVEEGEAVGCLAEGEGSIVADVNAVTEEENVSKTRKKAKARGKSKCRRSKEKLSCSAKKKKSYKPKVTLQVKFSNILRGSACQKFEKILRKPIRKKKRTKNDERMARKMSSIQKNSPNLFSNGEIKKGLPVQGILRNAEKVSSSKNESMQGDEDCSNLLEHFCDSAKHVSFSDKDEILGYSGGTSAAMLPELQNLCRIFSNVLSASASSSIKRDAPFVAKTHMENGIEDCPPTEQLVDEHCSAPSSLACIGTSNRNDIDVDRISFTDSMDINLVMAGLGNESSVSLPCNSQSSDTTVQISVQKDQLDSDGAHVLQTCPGGYITPSGNDTSRCDALGSMNSLVVRQPELQPPCVVEDVENNGKPLILSADPKVASSYHKPGLHVESQLSSKDPGPCLCSSSIHGLSNEARMLYDGRSLCLDKYMNAEFFGLPLNSQGERVHLHSSRKKFCSGVQNITHNLNMCSVSDIPEPSNSINHAEKKTRYPEVVAYGKNRPTQFPEPYYAASWNYGPAAREGKPECKYKDVLVYRDLSTSGIPRQGCQEADQAHYLNKGKSQIGDSVNAHYLNKGKSQIGDGVNATPQPPMPPMPPTMRLMGKNVTVGKSSQECDALYDGMTWTDKEVICNNALPTSEEWFIQQPSIAPKVSAQHRIGAPPGFCGLPTASIRAGPAHLLHKQQWMLRNGLASFDLIQPPVMNSFAPQLPAESFFERPCHLGTQLPGVVLHPQNMYNHVQFDTNSNHGQDISSNGVLPSRLPFPQDHGQFVQPYFDGSASNVPRWPPTASQNKYYSCPQFSNPSNFHRMYAMSGNDLLHLSSPYPTPAISIPVYGSDTSFLRRFDASVSTAFPSKPSGRDEIEAAFHDLGKHIHGDHRTRKRPVVDWEFSRPTKRANLVIPVNSSGAPAPWKIGMQSYGPLKLAAGAKHILKPPPLGQDKNWASRIRQTHSAIPLCDEESSCEFPLVAKRTAEIYIF